MNFRTRPVCYMDQQFGAIMRAKILTEAEIARTLAHTDAQGKTVILLGHRAGLRAMEIARLDWRSLVDASGGLSEWIDLPVSKAGHGAGRIPICKELAKALLKLAALRHFPRKGPVLLTPRGVAFTAKAMTQKIMRIYKRAGLDATSHSGRRTFLTGLSDRGLNAFQVKRAARHSHISTTELYVDDAASDQTVVLAINGKK